MIKPTVGRKVWYRPSVSEQAGLAANGDEPLDATVVAVHNDNCVNLVCFDANGQLFTRSSAYLRQEGGELPSFVSGYAEWMPYQNGQAKKESAAVAGAQSYDEHRERELQMSVRRTAMDFASQDARINTPEARVTAAKTYESYLSGAPAIEPQPDQALAGLAPHQQRVVIEASELQTKMAGLSKFLGISDLERHGVDLAEQTLMKSQLAVMMDYHDILNQRIEAFPEPKG